MKPEPFAELRERFEKWEIGHGRSVIRSLPGEPCEYHDGRVDAEWEVCKAFAPSPAQLAEAARRIAQLNFEQALSVQMIERILNETLTYDQSR